MDDTPKETVTPSLRVLVVDDSEPTLRLLKEMFSRRGDACTTAPNAFEALRLLDDNIFDLLLSDNLMPGMEGLELIKRAKVLQPQLVCILMSGMGTRRDLLTALQIGVFDFVDKPFPGWDLFTMIIDRAAERSRLIRERDGLLDTLKQQNVRLEFSLLRLHEAFGQLRQQEETLESDLAKAQRVQRHLLPAAFPGFDGLDLFGYYGPCDHLGGDFFHYLRLKDGRLAVYLADVAGHGVSAAMVTLTLREFMRTYSRRHDERGAGADEPASVLSMMNDALRAEAFEPPIFATMVYAIFDPVTGRVLVASAGHPAPLLISGTGQISSLDVSGPALGTVADPVFVTAELNLQPSDSLLLYSDGVTEALNAAGDEFSLTRLQALLPAVAAQPAGAIGTAIEQAVQGHLATLAPSDDMSFVVAVRPAFVAAAGGGSGSSGARLRPGSVKIVRPTLPRRALSEVRGRIQGGWSGQTCVLRLEGLVTWRQASVLRELIRLAQDGHAAQVDLDFAACESLDSTMLGLLLQFAHDVVIHQPGSRVVSQLHEMGILERFTISHEPCAQAGNAMATPPVEGGEACSDLILAAHEALMAVSHDNRERFKEVVGALRKGGGKD